MPQIVVIEQTKTPFLKPLTIYYDPIQMYSDLIRFTWHTKTQRNLCPQQRRQFDKQECNGVQKPENTYNIESKIQTQDLDLMIPSSTTIAMDDDDDSPLLARTLRFKSTRVRWCSNRSPLVTFGFSVPSLHFLNREKRH
ncbi:hypothetical protein CR513_39846, partial [Mucuna pruriens]